MSVSIFKTDNRLGINPLVFKSKRRLTDGSIKVHAAILAGAAIAYSAKWHKTISTSIMEAEFIQATSVAKMARYLRIIMLKLKVEQKGPMIVLIDNSAAIIK
eukprot:5681325-Ditylum_brightwellii.AAC.1